MSPYKIGIKNRPLKNNGLYNNDPRYEKLTYGNQTTISGNDLNKVIHNDDYNMFVNSPFELKPGYSLGLTKIIHVGK